MASTPEGRVKDAVKKELRKRDIWYFMPMQNGFGVVGIPDFICCMEGSFLAIETKAPGKRGDTTANQDRVIAEIEAHLGYAIVVDDVSQLITYLDGAGHVQ
jgi:hypothetical protein